jgi:hypothetical protein
MITLYWASWVSIVAFKSASNFPDNVGGTEIVSGDRILVMILQVAPHSRRRTIFAFDNMISVYFAPNI